LARVGIITALQSEADCLGEHLNHTELLNFVSGIGSEAAARAASQAVEAGCDTLVSYGYAGALDPALRAGDLVVGLSISNEQTTLNSDGGGVQQLISEIDKTNDVRARSSLLYAAPSIVKSTMQKSALRRKGGWDAVDMESFAIGCAAQQHGLAFLIIRAIADTANEALPDSLPKLVDERGTIRRTTALWEILKNPLDAPKYCGLAKAQAKADRSLRCVAPLLVQIRIEGRQI